MIARGFAALLLAALVAAPALAKDRRPGHADPDVSWTKQADQKDCGRAVDSGDAQARKGKHGQVAASQGTIPCASGENLSGKGGRNEPGRN